MLANPAGSKPKPRWFPTGQVPPWGLRSQQGLRALCGGWEISRLCLMVTSDPFRQSILSAAHGPAVPVCVPVCVPGHGCPNPFMLCLNWGLLDVSLFVSPGPRKPRALFPGCEKAAELIPDYRGSPLLWMCHCSPAGAAASPSLLGASCANLFVGLGSHCPGGIPSVAFKKLDLIRGC